MKWLRRILLAIVLLVVALAGVAYFVALRTERPVGFQVVRATDAGGQPFAVGVWYPTDARPWPTTQMGTVLMNVARDAAIAGDSLPLIVISHGNGGGPPSHADLAMALASEGYIVAAPMHPGDNFADQSGVGSASFFHERTRQLRATLDQLLEHWPGRAHIAPRASAPSDSRREASPCSPRWGPSRISGASRHTAPPLRSSPVRCCVPLARR